MRDAPRPEAITDASAAGVRAAEIRVTHQPENNLVALLDRKPRQGTLRARRRARAGACAVRRAGSTPERVNRGGRRCRENVDV